jgi:hypothetical protein
VFSAFATASLIKFHGNYLDKRIMVMHVNSEATIGICMKLGL